jgi:hypothetical protein
MVEMLGGIKLPTSLGALKSAVPGANALKAAAAKVASPTSVLAAAKGVAGKVNVGSIAKAAATGNVKGAMGAAANAAKTVAKNTAATTVAAAKTAATGVAQNAAVSAAASQVPGGNMAVKAARNLGIPSATILSTIGQGPGILDKIKLFFTTMDTKTMVLLGGIVAIFLLLLIGMILFFTQKKASNFQNVTDTSIVQGATLQDASASIGAQVKGLSASKTIKGAPVKNEGFANATGISMEADDLKLINLQPLTVKQAGFIGPLDAGVFQEAEAVKNTLNAGVRTFFFQIDYHEDPNKDSKLFPGVKEPCLLYRDDSGVLTSTNAGSILKMSQAIADIGFSNSVPSQTDPIVIILYGARVPADPVTNPKGYLAYCTKIASQLKPLAPFHLGMTAQGDYHRQALAGQLFTSPFKNFEKKVIIVSNFDTTLYRNVMKMGLAPYAPADDLDYWTHAQIFKDDAGLSVGQQSLGVTAVAGPNVTTRAKIYTINSMRAVIGAGEAAISAWATKNKSVFTIVVPPSTTNPSYDEISTMIKKMGVNVLPFDFFSFDLSDTKRRIQIWNSATWNMRPAALRPTK